MKNAPVPPYGVAIHDAIASGSLDEMRRVARDANAFLREFGDVRQLLNALEQEIARLEGSHRAAAADMIPYGDPMRAAVASGDVQRMKEMIRLAESWLARVTDVQSALVDLKVEVARQESKPRN
jgi:hypothetical protein